MKYLLYSLLMMCLHTAYAQEPAMLWMKSIGGNSSDSYLSSSTPVADGGVILCLQSASTSGAIDSLCGVTYGRTIFQKYNADASVVEWNRCYLNSSGDSAFTFMFPSSDGGFILGGQNFAAGLFRIHKEDAAGNVIWTRGYGGSSTQRLTSMIRTADGGYLMYGDSYSADGDVGMHYGSTGNRDFWLLKLDSIGIKQWSKVYGGTGDEGAATVLEIPGDGYFITGTTSSNDYDCTGNHGDYDAYVARINDTGGIVWHRDFGGSAADGANDACLDEVGGVTLAASSFSSDGDASHHIGGMNIWLVSVSGAGAINWENCYGGGGFEYPSSIKMAADGSLWIAAIINYPGIHIDAVFGRRDAWLLHTDGAGNYLNSKVIGSDRQDEGNVVYVLPNGTVLMGGYYRIDNGSFTTTQGFFDAFLSCFAPWPVGVASHSANEMKIFPNPAHDKLHIQLQTGETRLNILNSVGALVYQSSNNKESYEVDVSGWSAGMYYVQVVGALATEFQKFIVY